MAANDKKHLVCKILQHKAIVGWGKEPVPIAGADSPQSPTKLGDGQVLGDGDAGKAIHRCRGGLKAVDDIVVVEVVRRLKGLLAVVEVEPDKGPALRVCFKGLVSGGFQQFYSGLGFCGVGTSRLHACLAFCLRGGGRSKAVMSFSWSAEQRHAKTAVVVKRCPLLGGCSQIVRADDAFSARFASICSLQAWGRCRRMCWK